jgi:hypothetical protein
MLPSSRPDHFVLSLPSQRVRGGFLCFLQVDLTVSPCLYLLSWYVGFCMFRQHDLIIFPCFYLLSGYVRELYASVKST